MLLASCGPLEPMPKHMPPVGRKPHVEAVINSWEVGPELADRKKTIVDTLRAEGADDWRVAVVVAAALAETQDCSAKNRDASKDSQGDAKNFSAYNMNAYALRMVDWTEQAGPDLNDDAHLADATRCFHKGLNKLGETDWLLLHRGGQTALNDKCSYGCQEYAATIRSIASHLLADKSRLTDAKRYGCDIPHV